MIEEKSTNRRDVLLSDLLRLGLIISIATVLIGAVLLFWQEGEKTLDYSTFTGVLPNLKELYLIIASALNGEGVAIIQLGIVFLIATPVSRVALCVWLFFKERDYLYTALSIFVFAVLIYSLLYRVPT